MNQRTRLSLHPPDIISNQEEIVPNSQATTPTGYNTNAIYPLGIDLNASEENISEDMPAKDDPLKLTL